MAVTLDPIRQAQVRDVERAYSTVLVTELVPETETEQIVHEAAKLLDEWRPGWFWEIDLSTLCLSDGSACILGQLSGEDRDWGVSWRALGRYLGVIDPADVVDYPAEKDKRFYAFIGRRPDSERTDWIGKENAWRKEVTARL